jgi:hypothetical protein
MKNLFRFLLSQKAEICLTADLSMIHESDQLPTPLPLRGNRQQKKKNKNYRNEDEIGGNSVPHVSESYVRYPNRTFILYNTASVLSRIAQPIDIVNNTKWKYVFSHNLNI